MKQFNSRYSLISFPFILTVQAQNDEDDIFYTSS